MAEFADYILHQSAGERAVEVTIDMMEYEYVNGCEDPATLQAILTTLKEGKHGYYPDVSFLHV